MDPRGITWRQGVSTWCCTASKSSRTETPSLRLGYEDEDEEMQEKAILQGGSLSLLYSCYSIYLLYGDRRR